MRGWWRGVLLMWMWRGSQLLSDDDDDDVFVMILLAKMLEEQRRPHLGRQAGQR